MERLVCLLLKCALRATVGAPRHLIKVVVAERVEGRAVVKFNDGIDALHCPFYFLSDRLSLPIAHA